MTVEIRHEQLTIAANNIRGNEYNPLTPGSLSANTSTYPPSSSSNSSSILGNTESTHEYELNQSESLTFLYNLLYDDQSNLSKADILSILNSLKRRENRLPFSINHQSDSDMQGVKWPEGLKEKFDEERLRMGNKNWFHNISGSREEALKVCFMIYSFWP